MANDLLEVQFHSSPSPCQVVPVCIYEPSVILMHQLCIKVSKVWNTNLWWNRELSCGCFTKCEEGSDRVLYNIKPLSSAQPGKKNWEGKINFKESKPYRGNKWLTDSQSCMDFQFNTQGHHTRQASIDSIIQLETVTSLISLFLPLGNALWCSMQCWRTLCDVLSKFATSKCVHFGFWYHERFLMKSEWLLWNIAVFMVK